jgi:hypothetical protein
VCAHLGRSAIAERALRPHLVGVFSSPFEFRATSLSMKDTFTFKRSWRN